MERSTEKRLMQRPVLLFAALAVLAVAIGVFIALRGRDRQISTGTVVDARGLSGMVEGDERFLSQADCRAALTSPPPAMKSVVLKHDGVARTERYDVPVTSADAIRLCGENGLRVSFWTVR